MQIGLHLRDADDGDVLVYHFISAHNDIAVTVPDKLSKGNTVGLA